MQRVGDAVFVALFLAWLIVRLMRWRRVKREEREAEELRRWTARHYIEGSRGQ